MCLCVCVCVLQYNSMKNYITSNVKKYRKEMGVKYSSHATSHGYMAVSFIWHKNAGKKKYGKKVISGNALVPHPTDVVSLLNVANDGVLLV